MKDLYYTNQENYKIGDSKYPCHIVNKRCYYGEFIL